MRRGLPDLSKGKAPNDFSVGHHFLLLWWHWPGPSGPGYFFGFGRTGEMTATTILDARFDREAFVWVASGAGITTEAPTLETLTERIEAVAIDMYGEDIHIKVVIHMGPD